MADEQDGAAAAGHLVHLGQALLLERRVADRQHFVHQQDLRLQMRRNGECQPQIHTTRIPFDGGVDEPLDTGKGNHVVEAARNLCSLHAQNGAIQKDVLAPRQLRMKARANFEQAAHPAANLRAAFGRLRDAREDLQERALTGAVVADHPEHLAGGHLQRHVAQCPDRVVDRPGAAGSQPAQRSGDGASQRIAQRTVAFALSDSVAFAQAFNADRVLAHQRIGASRTH